MRVISVLNQKGGVAKTTTAAALAFAFAEKGYRTLVVDTDAQSNLTESFCFTADEVPEDSGMVQVEDSIYEVMLKEAKIKDAIYQTKYENLHICPSVPEMATLDIKIAGQVGFDLRLKAAFEDLADDYDYVIVDTPPALGVVTTNVMVASNYIIIPAEAEKYSVRGIALLAESLDVVKEYHNRSVKVLGILLTRFENISNDKNIAAYSENVAKALDTVIFDTKIRAQKFVKESRLLSQNIIEYARENRRAGREDAGSDYEKFADEVLEQIKKVEGK